MAKLIVFCTLLISLKVIAAQDPSPRQVLSEICDEKSQIFEPPIESKRAWSCDLCPSFTGFKGTKENFNLESFFPGDFTGSGKPELVVSLRGCEPHADGFGGVALFRKDSDKWKKIDYSGSESLAKCEPYQTKAKHTELFCMEGDMHAGTYSVWFTQILFDKNAKKSETQLLTDKLEFGGNLAGGDLANGYCYEIIPDRFAVSSQDPLRIVVTGSGGKYLQKDKSGECEPTVSKDFKFKFELDYDGTRFHLTSDSAKDVAAIRKFRKSLTPNDSK